MFHTGALIKRAFINKNQLLRFVLSNFIEETGLFDFTLFNCNFGQLKSLKISDKVNIVRNTSTFFQVSPAFCNACQIVEIETSRP